MYESGDDGSQYCYEPFSFEGQCMVTEDTLTGLGWAVIGVGSAALGAVGLTALGIARTGVQSFRGWMERRRFENARRELDVTLHRSDLSRHYARLFMQTEQTEIAYEMAQNGLQSAQNALTYISQNRPEAPNAELHEAIDEVLSYTGYAVNLALGATPSGRHMYDDPAIPRTFLEDARITVDNLCWGIRENMSHYRPWDTLYTYVVDACMNTLDACEAIVATQSDPPVRTSLSEFRVGREEIRENPLAVLKRFDREVTDLNTTLSFKIVGEPAIDAGGVRREVFSMLFKALMEKEDGTIRGLLKLSPDLSAYKALGKCLSYIIRHPEISLKEYFNRKQFGVVEALSVEELVTVAEDTDQTAVLEIKQKVKDLLLGLEVKGVRDYILRIESFVERETLDLEGIGELYELLEEAEEIDDEVEELKESSPEAFKTAVGTAAVKFLDRYNVDKLITLALALGEVPAIIKADNREERLTMLGAVIGQIHTEGKCYLDYVQAPMDAEKLAKAIVNGSMGSLTAEQRVALIQKTELIKGWVRSTATPEQRVNFYYFATANSGFVEGVNIKIIRGGASQGSHIDAHTCFQRLDIAPGTLELSDAEFLAMLEGEIDPNEMGAFTTT